MSLEPKHRNLKSETTWSTNHTKLSKIYSPRFYSNAISFLITTLVWIMIPIWRQQSARNVQIEIKSSGQYFIFEALQPSNFVGNLLQILVGFVKMVIEFSQAPILNNPNEITIWMKSKRAICRIWVFVRDVCHAGGPLLTRPASCTRLNILRFLRKTITFHWSFHKSIVSHRTSDVRQDRIKSWLRSNWRMFNGRMQRSHFHYYELDLIHLRYHVLDTSLEVISHD